MGVAWPFPSLASWPMVTNLYHWAMFWAKSKCGKTNINNPSQPRRLIWRVPLSISLLVLLLPGWCVLFFYFKHSAFDFIAILMDSKCHRRMSFSQRKLHFLLSICKSLAHRNRQNKAKTNIQIRTFRRKWYIPFWGGGQ